jgi:phosphopantothenoylcysteine decarboxylase/phosphopantothenate--cysteine ligase
MARVTVGVTGGIAAYKACELVRLLVRAGHDVTPLVTPGAERFVTAETFRALARKGEDKVPYPHLERTELLVVAPLTANTLAKLAHGLADNVLTEAALAHDGPLLVAPAMNVRMWASPATQANVAVLRARGAEIVGPASGELAEGEVGLGRMAEPSEIFARIEELLGGGRPTSPLSGKHVVVSAGGTREPLDAVRYVGNRSSGRMGVAVAAEARRRGAVVTLLAANLAVAPPAGVEVVETPTAVDLAREALARRDADVVVMAAAVADYAPVPIAGKRPKGAEPWNVELEPTLDVAKTLGSQPSNGRVLVAFGAETGADGLARKRAMLETKNVDLVVVNDIGRSDIGFDTEDNEVTLVTRAGEVHVPKAPKAAIATALLDEVERLILQADRLSPG